MQKAVYLPDPIYPEFQKNTLIFDLDETLIHCLDEDTNNGELADV